MNTTSSELSCKSTAAASLFTQLISFSEPTGPPVEDHDDKKDMAIDTVTPVNEEV
jgi:hypothetical protein